MSTLNESIVEDAALEWVLLRSVRHAQAYGGQVGVTGDPPSPRLRWTRLGYALGHGADSAVFRRAKPQMAPGEHGTGRFTLADMSLAHRLPDTVRLPNPHIGDPLQQ